MENFKKHIKEIEKKIGYTFKDKALLVQAFTRTSYCNENKKAGYQSNEVLEFFGDSVLSAAIVSCFIDTHTERYEYGVKTRLSEADFSNIKSILSYKKQLSDRIEALGINKYLIAGAGDGKLGIIEQPSVMEDLFESIIAGVYIDSGLDMKTVIAVVKKLLDLSHFLKSEKKIEESAKQSYKNQLQEFLADKKRRLPPPVYKTESEDGPQHQKSYTRICLVGDEIVGRGVGKNLKTADAEAAKNAILYLGEKEKAAKKPQKKEAEKSTETIEENKPGKKTVAKKSRQNPIQKPSAKEKTKTDGESKKPSLNENAVADLKALAQKKKEKAPEYRDLGQTESGAGGTMRYMIECRFMSTATQGMATTKKDARTLAAHLMLEKVNK